MGRYDITDVSMPNVHYSVQQHVWINCQSAVMIFKLPWYLENDLELPGWIKSLRSYWILYRP